MPQAIIKIIVQCTISCDLNGEADVNTVEPDMVQQLAVVKIEHTRPTHVVYSLTRTFSF